MNKRRRYLFVVAGCILHALILRVFDSIVTVDAIKEALWLPLLLLWPGWIIALWFFSSGIIWKKIAMAIIPIVIGLLIMGPVTEQYLFLFMMAGGART